MNKIKYWVERADKKFPHHPIVFQLKEKMLTLEKPNGNDEDLEKLITCMYENLNFNNGKFN